MIWLLQTLLSIDGGRMPRVHRDEKLLHGDEKEEKQESNDSYIYDIAPGDSKGINVEHNGGIPIKRDMRPK